MPAATRCRIPTCSRRRRRDGVSGPTPPSSCTTRAAGRPRRACGGCCDGSVTTSSACSTAASPRGSRPVARSRPVRTRRPCRRRPRWRRGRARCRRSRPPRSSAVRSGSWSTRRAGERYRGEVEPVDPVAGHIPARSTCRRPPSSRPTARSSTPPTLRERFAAAGAVAGEPLVAYCGSGVTAAHTLLALEVAGFGAGASLYAPSWSGWVADPDRPVER